MGLVTNMHRRGSVYYYRRRVPAELQAVVGRATIKESLNGREPTKARLAHAARNAVWESRFQELRAGLAVSKGPMRTELSSEELSSIITGTRYRLLSEDMLIRLSGIGGQERGIPADQFERHGLMLRHFEESARADLARGDVLGHVQRASLDKSLIEAGIRLDPESEAYRQAARDGSIRSR